MVEKKRMVQMMAIVKNRTLIHMKEMVEIRGC